MAEISQERAELQQIVESLSDEQVKASIKVLIKLKSDELFSKLASAEGIRVPREWPPKFRKFDPVPYQGDEPPSEGIIRNRR